MPAVPLITLGVGLVGTAYGISAQQSGARYAAGAATNAASATEAAAQNAATVDRATADYNARLDQAQAAQIDANTLQNIRTMRQDAAVYLSRQKASYAAAGVLADTGSALGAQITTAGRLEQQIQQKWVDAQQQQQALYSQATFTRAYGEAQAQSDLTGGKIQSATLTANAQLDRMKATLAGIDGGVSIARSAFGAYSAGVFDFGSTPSVPSSPYGPD